MFSHWLFFISSLVPILHALWIWRNAHWVEKKRNLRASLHIIPVVLPVMWWLEQPYFWGFIVIFWLVLLALPKGTLRKLEYGKYDETENRGGDE